MCISKFRSVALAVAATCLAGALATPADAATKTVGFTVQLESYTFFDIFDKSDPNAPVPPGYIPPEVRWGTLGIGGIDSGVYTFDTVTSKLLSCTMVIGGDCLGDAVFSSASETGFLSQKSSIYEFDLTPAQMIYTHDVDENDDYFWFGSQAVFDTLEINAVPAPPSLALMGALLGFGAWRKRKEIAR